MELSYQEMWGISPEKALEIAGSIMGGMRNKTAHLSETVSASKDSRPKHTDYLSLAKDLMSERRRQEQINILNSAPSRVSSQITKKDRANMNRVMKPLTIRPKRLKGTYGNEAKRLTRSV